MGDTHDVYRPSFFELAASDQLRDLLSPVSRYIFSVFAQRHPRYLIHIVNNHDELFALFTFFLEKHYLWNWDAPFSQSFYSLKLRPIPPRHTPATAKDTRLNNKERWGTLFFLVALPYLRLKAQDLFERFGSTPTTSEGDSLFADEEEDDISLNNSSNLSDPSAFVHPDDLARRRARAAQVARERASWLLTTRRKLVVHYPKMNLVWQVGTMVWNLAYLGGKVKVWRPWMLLIGRWWWWRGRGRGGRGVEVRRMGQEDWQLADSQNRSILTSPFLLNPSTGLPPSFLQILSRCLRISPHIFFESLKYLLPLSIFLFKFLEWWNSSDVVSLSRRSGNASSSSGSSDGKLLEPALNPPKVKLGPHPTKTPNGDYEIVKKRLENGTCPIDGEEIVNPTALPTGYVACYKCAKGFVEKFNKCPVTGMDCLEEELRRINF